MIQKITKILGLDIGEKRIGVAIGDSSVKIASPRRAIIVDGDELSKISDILKEEDIDILVLGFPRNQRGETTNQTIIIEKFAEKLKNYNLPIVFQDESLTSVLAEETLQKSKKAYDKSDIDSKAAALILQDFIEENYVSRF